MEATIIHPDDRSEVVLNQLEHLSKKVADNFCEISDLLHEAWEHKYYVERGYDSFHDYTEKELDVRGRKAYFLVQTTKKLKSLGIPWNKVREIGWRKTATIVPLLSATNHEQWIEEAKQSTLVHLNEKVKAEKKGRKASETPPVRITIQVDEDENTIIQAAIDCAKRDENINTSKAFVKICYDYFQRMDN
jgi:hypothetical protein